MLKKWMRLGGIFALTLSATAIAEDFTPAVEDAGVEAVAAAAKQPYQQAAAEEFISAEDQLQDYLARQGWHEGWDDKKDRMFVVYSESFDLEDPAYDPAFISKRSLYTTLASMKAKAKVIEFMRTQMSAIDQLNAPGTDVYEQLNAEYMRLLKKIEAQQKELAALLRQVDAKEADVLESTSWDNLSKEFLLAVIKKLDNSFDAGQLEKENQADYEQAKARYQEAEQQLAHLEQQAESLVNDIKLEAVSAVETLAKAPLMGATVLAQAESWDAEQEQYQVAVLLGWSKKLESSAQSILAGQPVNTQPKQGISIGDWARSQDVATMVGARQFVDQDGQRWIIGAYGVPLSGSSSAERAAKGRADLFAKKEAVMALFADVETHAKAVSIAQTRNGGLGDQDNTLIAESFAESTRQSVENLQVNGMSKLFSKTVTHPISGQKMYVILYGISAQSAASALSAEADSYAKAVALAKNNTYQQAQKQEYNEDRQNANSIAEPIQQQPTDDVPSTSNSTTSSQNGTVDTTENQSVFTDPGVADDF